MVLAEARNVQSLPSFPSTELVLSRRATSRTSEQLGHGIGTWAGLGYNGYILRSVSRPNLTSYLCTYSMFLSTVLHSPFITLAISQISRL